ncbi:hypothetical protein QUA43_03425 [Microcoleus sp. N9_B4]|uniref:hypothetical protein n=1 Tax=Microcoleus sp. N9_B4 TaxID=3055386 RepID=UPI002FCF4DB3
MSAIKNEQAKELLLKAEDLMNEEKYLEAIFYATAGLEIMFEIADNFFSNKKQFYFGFDPHNYLNEVDLIKGIYVEKSSNKEVSSKLTKGIKALKDGVQHSVDRIQELDETTMCYCLGINIEQYVRYRKMAGYFYQGIGINRKSGLFGSGKLNFDKKDAEVSLGYCANTIIKIEETLERLNKPLSEE